jgi:hypothetical protein
MVRGRWILGLILLGLLGSLALSPATYAQEATLPIAYGDTLEGQLSTEQYRVLYVFSGREGDILRLQMQALEGDLDPYLLLLDLSGTVIAFGDDWGASNAVLLEAVKLPRTGEYFIVATRFGHQQGSTTGRYQVTLEQVGSTTPSGAQLRYGDSIIGQVNGQAPQAIYFFEGQRGEVISLQMQRTSGNLDPWIDLANSQGQILMSGDDDPTANGTLNAGILNFTLPASDFYIIVATRYGRDAGVTDGSFLLKLESIPLEQRGLAPANAILLDYGAVISNRVDSSIPQRFYYFEGQRGDVVKLEMLRESGNLSPVLMLLDSNLRELARVGGTQAGQNQARLSAFVLPQNGLYYIMASRAEFAQGQSEGDFELFLDGRAGIVGVNYPEIFEDTPIEGFINAVLPYENFVFVGEAGQRITLRMEATSGDLLPLLTLYQSDKQITFDETSGNEGEAAILNFSLPEAGLYRVEASRLGRVGGESEGGYRLTLQLR